MTDTKPIKKIDEKKDNSSSSSLLEKLTSNDTKQPLDLLSTLRNLSPKSKKPTSNNNNKDDSKDNKDKDTDRNRLEKRNIRFHDSSSKHKRRRENTDDNDDDDEVKDGAENKEKKDVRMSKTGRGGLLSRRSGGGDGEMKKVTPKAQTERDLACAQVEVKQLLERLGERDREMLELRKELATVRADLAREQSEVKKYYQSVDARNSNLIEAVTHHMGKSHNTAMQTLQSSQLLNAQAFGVSIERLRQNTTKMKLLLPPSLNPSCGSNTNTYHSDVAEYLKQTVTDLNAGETLLQKIDKAIDENQTAVTEERAKLNKNMPLEEMKQLQQTLVELEEHLTALRFERNMLSAGLEKYKLKQMSNNSPIVVLPATSTSAKTT